MKGIVAVLSVGSSMRHMKSLSSMRHMKSLKFESFHWIVFSSFMLFLPSQVPCVRSILTSRCMVIKKSLHVVSE